MGELTLDFVAFDRTGEWGEVVLNEYGWTGPAEPHLRALQDRLYGCLDLILRGQFATEFPQSVGRWIIIFVRCDAAYQKEVERFIAAFADATHALPDWSAAGSPYVSDIRFGVNDRHLAVG